MKYILLSIFCLGLVACNDTSTIQREEESPSDSRPYRGGAVEKPSEY